MRSSNLVSLASTSAKSVWRFAYLAGKPDFFIKKYLIMLEREEWGGRFLSGNYPFELGEKIKTQTNMTIFAVARDFTSLEMKIGWFK